jgi:CheY-like chemotaxis protein
MLLVVDDDPRFLQTVQQTLAAARQILLARDGEQALQLLGAVGEELSVAMVDLDLPKIDGFQLISMLHRAAPDLPIIAISGVVQEHVLESAKEVGATAILRKPITSEWKAVLDRARAGGAHR